MALNWALKRSNLDTVLLVSSRQLANFDNVECICINVNTSGSLDKLLDFHKPDAIIHCAACSDVELCQNSPESANIANNKLAGMVAKSAFSRDIKLVHISTDHLFDGRVSMVDEEVECSPINEYAKTKLLGEQAVLESCPEALVLRLNFFAWGPYYRPTFSDWIINTLSDQKNITLYDNVFFTPLYAGEVVSLTHQLIDKQLSGVFNLASSDKISKSDFGFKIAEVFNLDKKLIRVAPYSPSHFLTRPLDMSLDNSKLLRTLCLKKISIYNSISALRADKNLKSKVLTYSHRIGT